MLMHDDSSPQFCIQLFSGEKKCNIKGTSMKYDTLIEPTSKKTFDSLRSKDRFFPPILELVSLFKVNQKRSQANIWQF